MTTSIALSARDVDGNQANPYLLQLHAEHCARQQRLRPAPKVILSIPLLPPEPPPPPEPLRLPLTRAMAEILQIVCEVFEVAEREIFSGDRKHKPVTARYTAMLMVREFTQASTPNIGRRLGRDHTTVVHGLHKIRCQMISDAGLRMKVWEVRARIAALTPPAKDGGAMSL